MCNAAGVSIGGACGRFVRDRLEDEKLYLVDEAKPPECG